ncbi:MAG: hypothetical protein ACOCUW_02970 [Gemmatimonadota bacterium]
MRIRRLLLFVLPLAFALAACVDSTGPRVPDDEEGGDDPPSETAFVTDLIPVA